MKSAVLFLSKWRPIHINKKSLFRQFSREIPLLEGAPFVYKGCKPFSNSLLPATAALRPLAFPLHGWHTETGESVRFRCPVCGSDARGLATGFRSVTNSMMFVVGDPLLLVIFRRNDEDR